MEFPKPANYRKATLNLKPRKSKLVGAFSAYGHASQYGAGLHVYHSKESDRPACVNVTDIDQAREYVKLLQYFITQRVAEIANVGH